MDLIPILTLIIFFLILIILGKILISKSQKIYDINKDNTVDKNKENSSFLKYFKEKLKNDFKIKKDPVFDLLIKHKETSKMLKKENQSFDSSNELDELNRKIKQVKTNVVVKESNKPKIEQLISENMIYNVDDNKAFILKSGKSINNIKDLLSEIINMNRREFESHVTSTNNDFANWIEHVFKDVDLAHELRKNRSKVHNIHALNHYVNKTRN